MTTLAFPIAYPPYFAIGSGGRIARGTASIFDALAQKYYATPTVSQYVEVLVGESPNEVVPIVNFALVSEPTSGQEPASDFEIFTAPLAIRESIPATVMRVNIEPSAWED